MCLCFSVIRFMFASNVVINIIKDKLRPDFLCMRRDDNSTTSGATNAR